MRLLLIFKRGCSWLLTLMVVSAGGFHLDLGSTVFCREGTQEGTRNGYNPKHKGCASHHPLLAVLAEEQFVVHGWLPSSNCVPARSVVAFLKARWRWHQGA